MAEAELRATEDEARRATHGGAEASLAVVADLAGQRVAGELQGSWSSECSTWLACSHGAVQVRGSEELEFECEPCVRVECLERIWPGY